ncbi:MAG: tetratricopeptide repeat protein [Rubrivivax sp.]|nr:tetratricopeptide repeat protein [Rubrivivax sp.]
MNSRTLVFTDVVDSTLIVQRLGDSRAAAMWDEHDRRSRRLLADNGGLEIDRSDGFFLLFGDVRAASAFALAYHRACAELGLQARIGIHLGPVSMRENAEEDVRRGAKRLEVDGLAKPIAARVMALAGPGRTLLSADAAAALADTGAAVPEPRGHYMLKGVDEPIGVFEIADGALPFEPPSDGEKAWRVVRAGDAWRPVREVPNNLLPERDAFVGRRAELAALAHLLDDGARLVTVVGPAGTGKTRLVHRYGTRRLGEWTGGVYFCDLSEARGMEGIHYAVASALGVPLSLADAGAQLGHAIAARGRCLVLLDNFEHLLDHGDATVGRWLDRAPHAALVVTSREVLRLPGEQLLVVEPLSPDGDGVELFTLRARAQSRDFELDDANREAVAEAVRLLDGLPLAIELAAARMRALTPGQLVRRLHDRFRILGNARGNSRQATLERAIDWSWGLLGPWERAALAQCSVFEGGFTIEAAEELLDLSPWPEAPPPMDVIQSLLDKSLLRVRPPARESRRDIDETYFGMYISIHEYAAARLDVGEARAARQRHGRHYARLGADDAIAALSRHGGDRARRLFALEIDNLVAACRRAVERQDADVASACYRAAWMVFRLQGPVVAGLALGRQVMSMPAPDNRLGVGAQLAYADCLVACGHLREATEQLEAARATAGKVGAIDAFVLATAALASAHRDGGRADLAEPLFEEAVTASADCLDDATRAVVLSKQALLVGDLGRTDLAERNLLEALALARRMGNRLDEAGFLTNLANLWRDQGHVDASREAQESALAIQREAGFLRWQGVSLGNLATLHRRQGRLDQALALYREAVEVARSIGSRADEARSLGNIGTVHLDRGEAAEAEASFLEALAIDREIGSRGSEVAVLTNLGALCYEQGRIDRAVELWREALPVARSLGERGHEAVILANIGQVEGERGNVDAALLAIGQALAVHRLLGAKLDIGRDLCTLGTLLRRLGRRCEAEQALNEAEALQRSINAPLELACVVVQQGLLAADDGRIAEMRERLREAEALAATAGAPPSTELGRTLGELRDALARGAPAG